MIEFLNRFFGRQTSGATAKERLRLVLMSDHLSLAPDMVEAMKRDLVEVISRYVQVDLMKIDVHFEHQDKALAMLANIPITGVNRNNGNGTSSDDHAEDAAANAAGVHDQTEPTPDHAEPTPSQAEPLEAQHAGLSRRQRRKQHLQNGQTPQTGSPAPAT